MRTRLPQTDAHLVLITVPAILLAVALLLSLHTLALPSWATAGAIFAAAALVGTALAVARLSIAQHRPSER